jgi:hypothetical protein
MNAENTKYLLDNYPALYSGYHKPMTETCMCWGFDCGDGWFEILRDLSDKLEPLDVVASQVKEKFGTLRFYLESGSDKAYAFIDEAEKLSSKTCEACGAPGSMRARFWLRTLCDECDGG